MVEEVTLERCQLIELGPQMTKDALERAFRSPSGLFSPPSDPAFSPHVDVAQRLIVLSLAGLADELTWARY
jgi:hypothetical protein